MSMPEQLKLWADDVGHPDSWEAPVLINTYAKEVAIRAEMSRFYDKHGMTEKYKTPEWIRLCDRINVMYFAILFAMERGRRE